MGNYLLRNKIDAVKDAVNEKVEMVKTFQMQQGDAMRSTQMAMQIAIARDQLQWGAGFYSILVLAAAGATHKQKAFPKMMGAPLLVLGTILAYNYDFAYGTKLIRVRQEAEHILENERHRLVPPKTMPTRKFWEKEAEHIQAIGPIPRVGEIWPFASHFK